MIVIFAGQRFHFAQEGFQIIEGNAFIFVIGGIEIEILPYFADKILCLIFHVAGPKEMICAPEQASSERILFALVISRIEIVIRFGCLVDDADHAIIFASSKLSSSSQCERSTTALSSMIAPFTAESIW